MVWCYLDSVSPDSHHNSISSPTRPLIGGELLSSAPVGGALLFPAVLLPYFRRAAVRPDELYSCSLTSQWVEGEPPGARPLMDNKDSGEGQLSVKEEREEEQPTLSLFQPLSPPPPPLPFSIDSILKPDFGPQNTFRCSQSQTSRESKADADYKADCPPGMVRGPNGQLWPAWVFCTRYSDRPSSGG